MDSVCDKVLKRRRKMEKGAKNHHMSGDFADPESCIVK